MTISTLRPSAYTAFSDDSDGTYLEMWYDPPDGYTNEWSGPLGTFTLTAGSAVKRVRTRVRMQSQTGFGASASCSSSVTIGAFTCNGAHDGNIIGTQIGAWTNTPGLTQSDIDAATVALARTGGLPRIHEVYVDVDYVAAPTFVTGSVTTPSMTATPTYTGTATIDPDSDTGAQTAVQARVFTAAQVAAGGFNPATSTPLWDSGQLTQTSPNVTQAAGYLFTGTTYHLYMRVAQLVGGATVWSAWDAAAATFTLHASLSPVGITTLVSTVNASAGTVSLVANRNTGMDAWSTVDFERSADGGATWRAVGSDTSPATNTATITDLFAPSATDLLYRAQAHAISGASSSWVATSTTVTYSVTAVWMKSPYEPELNTSIRLERPIWDSGWSNGWAMTIGSGLVVGGHDVQSGRSGTLRIQCPTAYDVEAVLAILRVSPVVLFQFPVAQEPGGDMWAAVSKLRRQRPATTTLIDLDVVETVEPSL